MNAQKTGELIAQQRKELGLTQKQLAERLYLSDRTVSKWERGAGFPDVAILGALADALQLSVVDLLQGEKSLPECAELSVRDAIFSVYRQTKRKLLKNFATIIASIGLSIFCICFFWMILEYNGFFLKDVSMSVPAVVYVNGVAIEETIIKLEGTRSEDTFVGRVAVAYVEKTTRDQVQGLIEFGEKERYPFLEFYDHGDFSDCGFKRQIYISDDLTRMALELKDGTIIATDDWLMELIALDGYYPLNL